MRYHKQHNFRRPRRGFELVFLVVIGLLMAGLTGCTNPKDEKLNMMMAESHVIRTPEALAAEDFNRELLAGAQISTDPGDILLGTGDLLQVEVFEAKELAAKVRVSSRGYITLPLVGPVEVKGLSAREAEVRIEKLYREKYIKDPHVNVFVEEHHSQRVTLIGELKNPGTYDYPSKMRLLDVLSLAGGLNERAGRTAQIRRMGQTPETSNTIIVDLDRMLRRGQHELNIQINGGDIIFVPGAGNYFISGAVQNPGAYPIKDQVFLLEAISTAGGFRAYADPANVVVIRHTQDGERQVMELDLEQPEVQELEIHDRDVIIAKASAWGKFVTGFGINLGVPGVGGFGYRNPEQ